MRLLFFKNMLFAGTGTEVEFACYIIYTFWGMEEIIINMSSLIKSITISWMLLDHWNIIPDVK